MQITFLVGNGFDISCGIDTSYRSFYNWYTKTDSKSEAIKAFKNDIKEYLGGKGDRWSDFELGLGKYSKEFTKETSQAYVEIYEDAHDSIIEYISSLSGTFEKTIDSPDAQAALAEGVLHFTQELTPAEQDVFSQLINNDRGNDTIVNFVSFNYTDTVDLCVRQLIKTPLKVWQYNSGTRKYYVYPNVLHIHGTIDHYPILGVCEEYQFENKELLECPNVSEIMIKTKSVQTMGERWYVEAEKKNNSSRIICVWGMSLGETDSIWWNKIADWLKADGARQLVIFWHTKTPPNGRSVYRYVSEKNKVIERFTQYSSFTKEDIDRISNRIHVVYNTEKVLRVSIPKKELVTT